MRALSLPRSQKPRLFCRPHCNMRRPYVQILVAFLSWKFLLYTIACVTPSPAYDTSTRLAWFPKTVPSHAGLDHAGSRLVKRLCDRLTRWDAVYFTKIAERGYVNEQEWAFGWGYTRAIAVTREVLLLIFPRFGRLYPDISSALLLSNICHLASAVLLYELTLLCSNGSRDSHRSQSLALSAILHILSPAGLFLSAPYSESLYSFLAFAGTYLYSSSLAAIESKQHISGNLLTMLSSIVFSVACTVRSNGLLNGVMFLLDFGIATASCLRERKLSSFVRLFALGLSGLAVGLGLAAPQYLAWKEFCTNASRLRPWCSRSLPSIYTWVQDYYWNVGLFRYWTLSNVPLFILALPTLFVLLVSGLWMLRGSESPWYPSGNSFRTVRGAGIVYRLAIIQLILAVMAAVSYHVQIITRLSSGCAIWYWWVAARLVDEGCAPGKVGSQATHMAHGKAINSWTLKWMIMYGLVQGVLFAGFLPPA